MIEEIINLLTELARKEGLEEIKVYMVNANDYCVKGIKNDKIVKCWRKGINRKLNGNRKINN